MEETDGQVEAVAEVIEPAEAEELSVRYSPAAIEANFDALEAHVRRVTEGYAGTRYDLATAQGLRDAKHDRSYLNGLKKEIEERRKAAKRKYSRPLEAFERRCREITDIVDEASEGIKAQLDAAEAAQRSRRRDALEAHYEEFAGLLAPVVPYGRLHEDRWLNKTCAEPKAIAELEEKVGALARDWETLKAQRGSMGHYEEAERKLFRTLDLGAAMAAAREAGEQDAAIAEMAAAVEAPAGTDEACEVVMEGGDNHGEGEVYAPEPMPPRPAPPTPATQAPAAPPAPAAGGACPWVVVVERATGEQMRGVAGTLAARGIRGTVMRGILVQACARALGEEI